MPHADVTCYAGMVCSEEEADIGTVENAEVLSEHGRRKPEPDGVRVFDLLVDASHAALSERSNLGSIVALATAHLRSPHSKRAYGQAVLEFMAWCANTGTSQLTKGSVHAYIGELNRLRMSPATVNLALCAIRRLASELAEIGLMSNESAAKIMRIRGPRRRGVRLGNWLNVGDAERLVHAPEGNTHKAKRDRALLAVLLGAGVRRSEAA